VNVSMWADVQLMSQCRSVVQADDDVMGVNPTSQSGVL
jgi:hypothetical protein